MIALYHYPSYISLVPHILLEEIGAEYRLEFVDCKAGAQKRDSSGAPDAGTGRRGLRP